MFLYLIYTRNLSAELLASPHLVLTAHFSILCSYVIDTFPPTCKKTSVLPFYAFLWTASPSYRSTSSLPLSLFSGIMAFLLLK